MRCDKHGNELGVSELTDMTYLPNGKFNLFSLSKMQMNGWLLRGNKEMIWLTNDWKLQIQYKYTVWDTPQWNHLAELGFAILTNHGRALISHVQSKCTQGGLICLVV
jgi:hypothetical protein